MGLRRFDRKFGRELLRDLPEAPAIYLFKDEQGGVLYVGKAKNVRRRLAQYRNASRRKAHRKMRELVRVAATLEVRLVDSETDALVRENELIRELRPTYNVDGAYSFLYPAVGTGVDDEGRLLLCIVSQPDAYEGLDLRWHGCFRPKWRAREAFDALVSLCGRIGHIEPKTRLPALPDVKGTRFVAVRRLGAGWCEPVRAFFDGESTELLPKLFDALLEQRAARIDRAEVQASIETLKAFFEDDAKRLRAARLRTGWADAYVPQAERDALFIRARGATGRSASSSVPAQAGT